MASPLYQDIVDDIRAQIATGLLTPGAALPTTRELCQTLGVSRQTVASAMIVLRTQGLIIGQQGRAVYVTADPRTIRALTGSAALVDDTVPSALAREVGSGGARGLGPAPWDISGACDGQANRGEPHHP